MSDQLGTFKEAIKVIIETEMPELLAPTRHMMRAVVLDVKGDFCDLQVLAVDDTPHALFPPLPHVPSPIGSTIQTGQLVRIGFYYGDPSFPFIDEVIRP
ncbi:hypothetical protein [Paenibacillus tyrfis]|uniref:Uncharacterized protein n=1 Tax=Paenibacillus tyrfis TaxID=1501230 RepID=A0A081NYA9_9BACL|nr:hypothetical protein [Paenibacillus tyrfis]KEQ23432.1 hypothetical protein ET33_16535 [Paenibacillus tyrfis]